VAVADKYRATTVMLLHNKPLPQHRLLKLQNLDLLVLVLVLVNLDLVLTTKDT